MGWSSEWGVDPRNPVGWKPGLFSDRHVRDERRERMQQLLLEIDDVDEEKVSFLGAANYLEDHLIYLRKPQHTFGAYPRNP